MLVSIVSLLGLACALPPETSLGPAVPPPVAVEQPIGPPYGGYWSLAERGTPEPPSGKDQQTTGSILLALGLLRTGAGIGELMLSRPSACGDGRKLNLSESSCRGFAMYAGSGIVLGSALAVSGITYLAIASHHRRAHRRWLRQRSGAAITPRSVSFYLHF